MLHGKMASNLPMLKRFCVRTSGGIPYFIALLCTALMSCWRTAPPPNNTNDSPPGSWETAKPRTLLLFRGHFKP